MLDNFIPGNSVASAQGTIGGAIKLPVSHSVGKILAPPDKAGYKNQSQGKRSSRIEELGDFSNSLVLLFPFSLYHFSSSIFHSFS